MIKKPLGLDKAYEKIKEDYLKIWELKAFYDSLISPRTPEKFYEHILTKEGYEHEFKKWKYALTKLDGRDMEVYEIFLKKLYGSAIINCFNSEKFTLTIDDTPVEKCGIEELKDIKEEFK